MLSHYKQPCVISRLSESELLRLFTYHAVKYFEGLGATRSIINENVSGPKLRYLPLDADSGEAYRYVADFFYEGTVFVIDAISGELIRAGNFGAATRISAGQSAGLS